jgi:4-amino-4-deoxy-L-arabinose transferase-like glycosyltransferase
MLRANQRYWLVGLAVLFGFAVYYVHGIHTTYMTVDEYLAYRFTRDSLSDSLSYLANRDVHPPLWFSFFWLWHRIAGESDFAGRMQAILFSMMTMTVVYQLGRCWFGSARYGLMAMVILGVSSLFFWYTHEIRPYGLAMLAASLSMLAFGRWLRLRTRRSAILYAASVALLLYIHYFLFLFIAVQMVYFFVVSGHVRRMWREGVLVALAAFIFWLLWFPNFLTQFQHIREVELASGMSRGVAGSGATTQATSIEAIWQLVQLATNGQPGLYGLIFGVSVYFGWRRGGYRLAFTWALGLPLIAFTFNLVVAVYTPRYIVNFVIGLALVLAVGFAALPRRIRWGGLAVFAAVSLWALPGQLPKDIIPYRDLFIRLEAESQPGDVLFFDKGNQEDRVFQWQGRHIFSAEFLAARTIVYETDEALAARARRIWHVTAFWFNEDVSASFQRIEQTHPRQGGWGQCDVNWCYLIQLLVAPPWDQPQTFGDQLPFWGYDLDRVTAGNIRARLWWRADRGTTASYSIGLHLTDAAGNLVVQSDGVINNYDQALVDTTQLVPGQIYVDFRSLTPATPLSSGDYRLSLIVYDWQTGERLRLLDGTDRLELETIHIVGGSG